MLFVELCTFFQTLTRRLFNNWDPFHQKYGSAHGDDFLLLFDPGVMPIDTRATEEDKTMAEMFVEKIGNFARSHDPNGEDEEVKWERYY